MSMQAGAMLAGLWGTCGILEGVCTHRTHTTARCPKAEEQSARCELERAGCVSWGGQLDGMHLVNKLLPSAF